MRCDDENWMPASVQRIRLGFSSNASVTLRAVVDPKAIVAMTLFWKKYDGFAIAVSNASCEPSGDHCGLVSGPSCATTTCVSPVAGITTEMSALPPSAASLVAR